MFNAKTALAGLLAATVVNGHMVITSPQPHSFILTDATSKGRPLDATGSEFPCRNSGSLDYSGPVNSYALGSKQQLALQGTAVHGGGSCQLSITYDTEPSKDSVFKVIHTIQNGCPARDTPANLAGDDANAADPFTYDYTIPSNIPAGNATIAWTWINRVGNREFYMNCGVLELTGTGGDKSNFDSLPDLFIANQASVDNGCTTDGAEPMDLTIPDPGESVESNAAVSGLTAYGATCKSTAGSGAGSGTTATASYPTSAAATSAATSIPGGVFITSTKTATTAVPVTTAAPVTTAVPVVTSTTAAPAASATAGTGSGSSGSVKSGACSPEGTFSCASDGSSYQQCGSGTWSTEMAMAAGTVCTPGDAMDMKIAFAGGKRVMRALRN